MTRYKHTQFGTVMVMGLSLGALLLLTLEPVITRKPSIIGILVLLAAIVLFGSLTLEISESFLTCRFGIGLIRKSFALSDIHQVEKVRNRWFYGWGIRYTPHGWLYSVSGLDAIEVRMSGNKSYRIGTDQPEELVRALRQATSMPPHTDGGG